MVQCKAEAGLARTEWASEELSTGGSLSRCDFTFSTLLGSGGTAQGPTFESVTALLLDRKWLGPKSPWIRACLRGTRCRSPPAPLSSSLGNRLRAVTGFSSKDAQPGGDRAEEIRQLKQPLSHWEFPVILLQIFIIILPVDTSTNPFRIHLFKD